MPEDPQEGSDVAGQPVHTDQEGTPPSAATHDLDKLLLDRMAGFSGSPALLIWLGYRSIFLVVAAAMAGAIVMFAMVDYEAAEAQVRTVEEADRRLAAQPQPVAALSQA